MTVLETFLLMLEAGGGKMAGKTLIQKRAYFLNELLKLGLRFKPHYYGPFCPALDDAIGRAQALGFVKEDIVGFGLDRATGFEVRRFDYSLTPDGKVVVERLKSRYAEEWAKIVQTFQTISAADNNDYVALSLAAKTFFILTEARAPLTTADVAAEAGRIGWRVSEEDVDKAARLLVQLGLVKYAGADADRPAAHS